MYVSLISMSKSTMMVYEYTVSKVIWIPDSLALTYILGGGKFWYSLLSPTKQDHQRIYNWQALWQQIQQRQM